MSTEKIDDTFISHAFDISGDTSKGLSGVQIIKYCNSYAVNFGVNIDGDGSFDNLVRIW